MASYWNNTKLFIIFISRIFVPGIIASVFLTFFLLIFLNLPSARGEIYTWTDQKGIKQFSNIAPPQYKKIQLFDETITDKEKPLNPLSSALRKHGEFKVLKVYDGDTIKVKGYGNLIVVVRFAGIDAPETRKKDTPGQPYGKEAKQMVENLISGKRIMLKTYGTGVYNRVLAEIFTKKGININLELVKAGLAEVYRGLTPAGFDTAPYLRAETAAKRTRRGMWSLGSLYESPGKWRREHPWKRR